MGRIRKTLPLADSSTIKYFLPWVTAVPVAIYSLYAGMTAISRSGSLGVFLADIRRTQKLGTTFGQLYDLVMPIQTIIPEGRSAGR